MTSRPTSSRRHVIVGAILVVMLYVPGIEWGLPSEFSPSLDSPAPYTPLAFVAEYSRADTAQKYPAFHTLLLLPTYGLVLTRHALIGGIDTLSSTWPHGFRDPVAVFGDLIRASRLVTVLMAALLLLGLGRIRVAGCDARARWLGLCLFGLSGTYVFFARVGNLDVPYSLWWGLSLLCLWRHQVEGGQARPLLGAAVFSALAVATKDQAAGLAVGAFLTVLFLGPRPNASRVVRVRAAVCFAAVAFVAYALVAVAPQPLRWFEHIKHWLPSAPGVVTYRQFENTPAGQVWLLRGTVISLARVVSWPGLVLAGWGSFALWRAGRKRELAILIVPALTYYLCIIVPIGFVYDRFMLPIGCLCAVLAGVGFSELFALLRQRTQVIRILGYCAVTAFLLAQSLTGYVPVTALQVTDTKGRLARSLPDEAPPGTPILWLGGQVRLPNADVYRAYPLVLPPNERPRSQAMAHVFHAREEAPDYILSEDLIDGQAHNKLSLVRRWEALKVIREAIISDDVRQRFKSYYLYRTHRDR